MSDGEGPWIAAEEVRCGLLLVAPEAPGPDFAAELAAVLATGAVIAVIAGADRGAARAVCAEHKVACLSLDQPDPAADGVHLSDPAAVADARRRLGPKAIIGASCDGSRHLAMVAGEEGADYVLFRAGPDRDALIGLCRWWSELFVLPCAVEALGAEAEIAGCVEAGADFIAVGEAVWGHLDGAAEAARGLMLRIEQARAQRQGHP